MYSFDEQLAIGEAHEQRLDAYWRGCGVKVEPATRDEQRRGIDRWLVINGTRSAVEYKSDERASSTRNAFVETVSVDTDDKLGWVHTSEAEYLLYFLPRDGLLYILRFSDIRRRLPRWERECRLVKVQNDGYRTHGLLVPLREFEAIAVGTRSVG